MGHQGQDARPPTLWARPTPDLDPVLFLDPARPFCLSPPPVPYLMPTVGWGEPPSSSSPTHIPLPQPSTFCSLVFLPPPGPRVGEPSLPSLSPGADPADAAASPPSSRAGQTLPPPDPAGDAPCPLPSTFQSS